jgi:hypothetical protein
VVTVEHRRQSFGVILPHRLPDVLHHPRHIEGDDQPAAALQFVLCRMGLSGRRIVSVPQS